MKIVATIPGDDFGGFGIDMLVDSVGDYFVRTQAQIVNADWQDYIDFNVLPPARLACVSGYQKTVLTIKGRP